MSRAGSWVKAWDARWARVVQGQFHTNLHLLAMNDWSNLPFQPLFHATVFLSNRRVCVLPFWSRSFQQPSQPLHAHIPLKFLYCVFPAILFKSIVLIRTSTLSQVREDGCEGSRYKFSIMQVFLRDWQRVNAKNGFQCSFLTRFAGSWNCCDICLHFGARAYKLDDKYSFRLLGVIISN